MSGHPEEGLALAAAGVLDEAEVAELAGHLSGCPPCVARAEAWREAAATLRALGAPRASRALVARTRGAVELLLAERAERTWNAAAGGFLVAFAWTLAVVTWAALNLAARGLAPQLSTGTVALGYAAYLAVGWFTAAGAAVLVGRRAQEERSAT